MLVDELAHHYWRIQRYRYLESHLGGAAPCAAATPRAALPPSASKITLRARR
jgi:hypothetical protein